MAKKNRVLDFDIKDAPTAQALVEANAKSFMLAIFRRCQEGDIELTKAMIPRVLPAAEKGMGEGADLMAAFGTDDVQALRAYATRPR